MKVARKGAGKPINWLVFGISAVFIVIGLNLVAAGFMIWLGPAWMWGSLMIIIGFSLVYWGLHLTSTSGGKGPKPDPPRTRWREVDGSIIGQEGDLQPYYMREPVDQEHLIPWDRVHPIDKRSRAIIRIGGYSMTGAGMYSFGLGLIMSQIPPGIVVTPIYMTLGVLGFYYGIQFTRRRHRYRVVMALVPLMFANVYVLFVFMGSFGISGTVFSILSLLALALSWNNIR